MAIEVFNRYENKYMLDDKTCQALQARLSDYCELDAYNKRFETYPICNIYYDTEDSCLIRTSLAKPSYKEKLRIRSYGVPDAGSNVYVEIKKKHRNLVNKRRSALPLRDAYSFLRSGVVAITPDCANAQVLAEIQCILERHQLMPKAFISYERKAYFGTDHHDLRISFDTEIRTRRTSLRLESGIFGERLMPDGKWLMEIKTSQSIPVWLCRMLSEYKIYPVSFSKYGAEYKKFLRNESNCAEYQQVQAKSLAFAL